MAFDGSYPAPPGNKHFSIVDVPITTASYTQLATGSPPTGGISINAQIFGLKYVEWAQCMGSDNGQYDAVAYVGTVSPNRPTTSLRLQIIVSLTGAELAAAQAIAAGRTVRVLVLGF